MLALTSTLERLSRGKEEHWSHCRHASLHLLLQTSPFLLEGDVGLKKALQSLSVSLFLFCMGGRVWVRKKGTMLPFRFLLILHPTFILYHNPQIILDGVDGGTCIPGPPGGEARDERCDRWFTNAHSHLLTFPFFGTREVFNI